MVGGSGSHDNNFNLLRLVAAVVVVFSHSFNISRGTGYTPLGVAFGDIAVDVFFVTSGYLVTGAALSRRDAVFFVRSRLLRIYPALLVALALTVFVVGPLVTRLSFEQYLSDEETYRFLFSNSTLISPNPEWLPGVFEENPLRSAVNQPLWSLRWEMAMYIALFLFTLPYVLWGRYRQSGMEVMRFIFPLIFVGAMALLLFKFGRDNLYNSSPLMVIDMAERLIAMFFGGASVWLWRDRIRMAGKYGFMLLVVLSAAAIISPFMFVPLYYLSVVWLTLIVGRSDLSMFRRANRMGDYSYGIYIYSYPVQQIVVLSMPGIGPMALFGLAMLGTVPLAVLSWHLIEKRALGFKYGFRRRTPAPPTPESAPAPGSMRVP